MKNKYAFTGFNEKCAKAIFRDQDISTKHSVEICRQLRGKPLAKAITYLEDVIALKQAVPFLRYLGDVGHKRGMAAGRYPVKASKAFLRLIKSAQKNASNKGLDEENLIIKHICAHKASRPMRYGRKTRREMKRTHIEIVVEEAIAAKKTQKKQTPEKPVKPVEKEASKKDVKEESKLKEPTTEEVSDLKHAGENNKDKQESLKNAVKDNDIKKNKEIKKQINTAKKADSDKGEPKQAQNEQDDIK